VYKSPSSIWWEDVNGVINYENSKAYQSDYLINSSSYLFEKGSELNSLNHYR